jgi:hypothetical protein
LDGRGEELGGRIFLDERADERQREALQTILGGQAGGWPATFATLVETEIRGLEFVPSTSRSPMTARTGASRSPGKVRGSAEALTGPTSTEGARVEARNAPGAEVGPGEVATWGVATADEVDVFGFKWDWAGRSSKHFTFDWSGPDET